MWKVLLALMVLTGTAHAQFTKINATTIQEVKPMTLKYNVKAIQSQIDQLTADKKRISARADADLKADDDRIAVLKTILDEALKLGVKP